MVSASSAGFLSEGGFEDGHAGVDEREDMGVIVSDTGVAVGVGGLNVGFVLEGEPVMVVRADDVGGLVGGVVIDGDYLIVGGLGEEGLDCCFDAFRTISNGDDYRNYRLAHNRK